MSWQCLVEPSLRTIPARLQGGCVRHALLHVHYHVLKGSDVILNILHHLGGKRNAMVSSLREFHYLVILS